MSESPRAALAHRALALLCAASVVFLAARDLLVPEVRDVEVWFGFELHGLAARLTAPLHWAIFAFGATAFWRAEPWIWRAAAGYAFYVGASHWIWSATSPHGHGGALGALYAALFSAVGVLLLRLGRPPRE